MSTLTENAVTPMSVGRREQFERDGYLVIPGALSGAEVERYAAALDEVYRAEQAAGRVAEGAAMHKLSAVASSPPMVGLIDHPSVFPLVWSVLGWNIHVYHSHLDAHPTIRTVKPYRFEWHQDGNRDENDALFASPEFQTFSPIQRQLLGASLATRGQVPGDHQWGHYPQTTPLHGFLAERGLLDPQYPPLKP